MIGFFARPLYIRSFVALRREGEGTVKYIFLDVDGVLNRDGCAKIAEDGEFIARDPLLRLAEIVEKTDLDMENGLVARARRVRFYGRVSLR